MQVLFEYQDLWNVVETGLGDIHEGEENLQQSKEIRTKDAKARCSIYQFEKVANARTAKEAWDVLVNTFK